VERASISFIYIHRVGDTYTSLRFIIIYLFIYCFIVYTFNFIYLFIYLLMNCKYQLYREGPVITHPDSTHPLTSPSA